MLLINLLCTVLEGVPLGPLKPIFRKHANVKNELPTVARPSAHIDPKSFVRVALKSVATPHNIKH